MRDSLLVFCLVFGGSVAVASEEQANPPSALTLLAQVAATYASAGDSYHIDAVEEQVSGVELSHQWEKTYSKVVRATGNRYRVEMRSAMGSYVVDSDGETEWTYQGESKLYIKRATIAGEPGFPRFYASGAMLRNVWDMKSFLEAEASAYKRATLLPDETISIDEKPFDCYVIYASNGDRKKQFDASTGSHTYWIDKQSLVVRKSVQHLQSFLTSGPLRVPNEFEITTTYPVVNLAASEGSGTFDFTPPSDAKEVASFDPEVPAPPAGAARPTLAGKVAPSVDFVSRDGKAVSLRSMRGKPVLVNFWTTWCGPCLVSMPALERLSSRLGEKVTVITVDEDEDDGGGAAEYLARHHYRWQNYHDDHKGLFHAFEATETPQVVLINAKGKVVYDGAGTQEDDLVAAIGRLGPGFSRPDR